MATHAVGVLSAALESRRRKGLLRSLSSRDSADTGVPLVDFCSNDYLGLARCPELQRMIDEELPKAQSMLSGRTSGGSPAPAVLGSSGSRLLSGNNAYAESVEQELADFHSRESALLFTSGYDANLAMMACVPQKGDVVVFDSLCHNSLREGMRLGRQKVSESFKHNDVDALKAVLSKHQGNSQTIFIVVESVYSMDGDVAPLKQILDLAVATGPNVCVIVDEAHGTGVFGHRGKGVVGGEGLERHPALFASVHTFGKAIGSHGAVVVGSPVLKVYLLNYARSLVYTTALPLHSLVAIRCAYRYMSATEELREKLNRLIKLFAVALQETKPAIPPGVLLASDSPIQAVLAPGNARVVRIASDLRRRGFDVLAIRAPTVPAGTERLRVIIHSHNTEEQVRQLSQHIAELLQETAPAKL